MLKVHVINTVHHFWRHMLIYFINKLYNRMLYHNRKLNEFIPKNSLEEGSLHRTKGYSPTGFPVVIRRISIVLFILACHHQ